MPVSQSPFIPIPDTRFANVFNNALNKEVKKQNLSSPNFKVVAKVLIRDIILMPFVQSIVWTGFLISFKPMVRHFIQWGKAFITSIYKLVLGTDLIKKDPVQ